MTEADGSVDSGARPGWRWDVALSFAGAQREYVDQVAQALKARELRCFYDADEEMDLWGKYLVWLSSALRSHRVRRLAVGRPMAHAGGLLR